MSTIAADANDKFGAFVWKVSGMDCGSCAAKIRGAVERMPGVEHVKVAIATETLSLRLDADRADPTAIEATVRALGYGREPIAPRTAPASSAAASADAISQNDVAPPVSANLGPSAWWRTAKGRLVMLTGALLAGAWAIKLAVGNPQVAAWGFVAACLIGVAPIARRAVAAARAGMPFTIEMLMTIAAAGALVIGAAEEAALVVFLFAVGEVLEGVAAERARAGIRALADLVPKTATIEEGGATRQVPAASLRIGQIVLARPGDRIPADGEIVEGVSSVNEAPVTGESMPKAKGPGDPVFAGSINSDAALRVEVTKGAEDNTIARIIRLVEEAQEARAPTERFIDRFSRIYMPAVVALAVLVTIVPPLFLGGDWGTWVYRGLTILLIGCPCALVISVPASIASALSAGARRGLLLKGGAVIEAAARTRIVAFDKTGTLTRGEPKVTDIVGSGVAEAEVLRLAAAVETGSNHPLAQAILARAEADGLTLPAATGARAIPGRGMEARIDNESVFVGSPRFASEAGALPADLRDAIDRLEGEGKTVAAVFRSARPVGLIALRDEAREDARAAVAQLKALGVSSVMLTGDNARTGAAIAGALGMDHRAQLLPDDKVAEVKRLAAGAPVMMVGDGINDAPALAAASVGVAMGSGTDVALETADAALLRSRVTDVPRLIRLSRAAMGNIRQNIAVALGLKAVFLVTSVFGYTGLWVAILADTGATVLVTLNALRLLGFERETRT